MLKFIANLFKGKPEAPIAPAPYKVETPAPVAEAAPKKAAKKPTVKKATTRKPKAPKA